MRGPRSSNAISATRLAGRTTGRTLNHMRIDVPGGHISAVIGGRSAQPLPQLRPDREVLAAFGDPGQRALLITGEHDGTRLWLGDATERQAQWLPGHAGTHVIPGCGHWVQQERPEHV